jgi:hypothetical protein
MREAVNHSMAGRRSIKLVVVQLVLWSLVLAGFPVQSIAQAAPTTEQGTLVQIIHTSQFSPASPDPAGIAYLPATDRLIISDSEVEEMAIYAGVNLWQFTRTGTVTDTGTTTAFSNEPTGLGFNPADGTLFVADDQQGKRIFLVRPGPDGRYGTPDDERPGSIDVRTFGLPVDPEGVEFDPNSGHVFIADGAGREVWRVDPGPNATFGDADDVVSHFDVEVFGVRDPEGISVVAARDNLLIVDNPSKAVYEVTKTGELVRKIDLSTIAGLSARWAGVVLAPGTNDPNRLNLWIAARGVDNDADPNENDGKVYEIAWPSAPQLSPTSILAIPIAAGSDDAEEKPNGVVRLAEAALELVNISAGPQTVGLRFTGVALPAGATMINAYVQFQARASQSVATNLLIQGEASDNAATFLASAGNITARQRTAASVQWLPPKWVKGQAGSAQQTPSLTAILQEIFARPGWVPGNAVVFIISGTGKRVARSFEDGGAPVLNIEYIAP